ncbi:hypothetical protein PHLGIDRAFT_14644 [Phlebiopsis gigantea 11061_1 CR5-6]|uniref:Protein kinase domain-containing protein n=1 Tax=Phlebiopsis gigantea (strain 11061_1 CR5-6) TaxID=745531 RepID=A0A0C3RVF6_PHLG1|nr:hypothetical protein PHLGIDRAFT_14644 [Phlebiopsis gigantea 11061_1 CR5-6]
MTSFAVARTIAATYPEGNPFALKPDVLGLFPYPDCGQEHDTPELRAAALAIAQARNGFNVLALTYGTNPLFIDDPALLRDTMPLTGYQHPPALAKLELPSDAECDQVLDQSTTFRTLILKSKDWVSPRLLKVVCATHSSFGNPLAHIVVQYLQGISDNALATSPSYLREREAYAHLVRHSVPDGVVQTCFGSVYLSNALLDDVQRMVGDPKFEINPEALLLEYIPGAVKPAVDNTTLDITHKLLRCLYDIHAAYILHGAIHTRNMRFVLSPDGKTATRVFWTDFTEATCASSPSLRRQDLFLELQACWDYLFGKLVGALAFDHVAIILTTSNVDACAAYRVRTRI